MIVKKTAGCIIQRSAAYILAKGLLDIFIPKSTVSNRWKHWKATIDFKTCTDCLIHHGKVYRMMNIYHRNLRSTLSADV